jgi:hypothetical protein
MPQESVKGSCLCGSIKFEIKGPLSAFRYCYCSRCRKASGAAHAANIVVPHGQLTWLAGEELVTKFHLPGAQRFAVWFCPKCGTRAPHKIKTQENYLVPAGLLDDEPPGKPEHSIFCGSRPGWYTEPQELPKFREYPTP